VAKRGTKKEIWKTSPMGTLGGGVIQNVRRKEKEHGGKKYPKEMAPGHSACCDSRGADCEKGKKVQVAKKKQSEGKFQVKEGTKKGHKIKILTIQRRKREENYREKSKKKEETGKRKIEKT